MLKLKHIFTVPIAMLYVALSAPVAMGALSDAPPLSYCSESNWYVEDPVDSEQLSKYARLVDPLGHLNINDEGAYLFQALRFLSTIRIYGPNRTELNSWERSIVSDFYSDEDLSDIQQSNSIRFPAKHDAVTMTATQFCNKAEGFHQQALQTAHTILIEVRGIGVVGLLKREDHGDPTLLAVRNVVDLDGRATLVAGGMYRVDKQMIRLADKPFRGHDAYLRVSVDTLTVLPGRFLDMPKFLDSENTGSASSDLAEARRIFRLQWREGIESIRDQIKNIEQFRPTGIPIETINCRSNLID